jgi:hypothetical protein
MRDTTGEDTAASNQPVPNDARTDARVDQGQSDDVRDSLTANGDDDYSVVDEDLPGSNVVSVSSSAGTDAETSSAPSATSGAEGSDYDTTDVERVDLDTSQQ